ncbi:MAG: isochorismatase family cysteine hydrolase [Acidimicrobiia bacterium]
MDTIPYPWPYDGADGLAPERLALVIAGAQQHWTYLADDDAVAGIAALADTLRDAGVLIVFVRHARPLHTRRPRHDLPIEGTRGWELSITPNARDLVVDTRSCDGFFGDHLDFELRARGRDHLLACGFAAEVLVDGTVRSANDRGYECLTLRDAAVPLHPDTGERVLASVTMSGGIFGAVGSTDAVLTALGCSLAQARDSQEVVA